MATVRYGGAEYSYPGGPGLDEAIRCYAAEHAGDAARLGDGTVSWSATLDYAPLVFPASVWLPDGKSYDGTVTVDARGSITFTPTGKDALPPPP